MKAMIWTTPAWNKFWANPKRMHEYVNCRMEYRDVTEEEIAELRIPEAMVTVLIPIEVFMRSEEMQNKIKSLDLLYNWLDRRTFDWYLHIENIDTHDVPEYLSLDEYTRMKNAGVIFPPEIIEIYENTEDWWESNVENDSQTPVDNWEENSNSWEEAIEWENVATDEE